MLTGKAIVVISRACHFWRDNFLGEIPVSTQQQNKANSQIRAREVRVITDSGEQLGVLQIQDALAKAKELGLDLVEIAPTAKPPVCKIMDFGSFKFQRKRKEREAKKKQHVIHIKEIRLSPKIEKHDFEVKLRKARGFLDKKDRVLLNMRFRGREMMYMDAAEDIIREFVEACSDIARADGEPRRSGRRVEVTLLPGSKTKG